MSSIRNTFAIAGRELRSYFVSPVGYVVLSLFMLLSGWFFVNLLQRFGTVKGYYQAFQRPDLLAQLNLNDLVMAPLMQNMIVLLLIFIPAVTMRLWSEEKKQKTDQLLLTSPISVGSIVGGKFLAAIGFLVVMLLLAAEFPLILYVFSPEAARPDWGPVATGYLGLFLCGTAFVAMGLFTSSLTENQVVAFVASLFLALGFYVIGWPAENLGALGKVLKALWIPEYFQELLKGILSTTTVAFFASFAFFWLFLTQRSIESVRWR
ncbi:MAG: ABC transporter permease subunit [Myxococcales bacterium]|nr:ABC transporter permease subunit [Myxococcales bacterium]